MRPPPASGGYPGVNRVFRLPGFVFNEAAARERRIPALSQRKLRQGLPHMFARTSSR